LENWKVTDLVPDERINVLLHITKSH